MERFLNKMVLSVVLISSVCSLCAQETKWSLENCIRYAMENNIQIRQKQLEKENNGEIDRAERRKMKGVVQKREKEGWAGKK